MSSPKLTEAFRILRKKGLIAKQNFWCCRTCADHDIGNILDSIVEKGKPIPKGCVYYTKQDADDFKQHGVGYLAYAEIKNEDKSTPLSTVEVGEIVCEAIENVGLKHEWDKDPNKRIKVIL